MPSPNVAMPRRCHATTCLAGCQQTVVSEYTHTSLSAGQQSALVEAFGLLSIRQHNGISVGSVLLVNEERVAGMARYGMVWYGTVRYGTVRYDMARVGMVWHGMVWYGMVWYGMVWYGMVWYGMVWYGMIWYGMVWYGMTIGQYRDRDRAVDDWRFCHNAHPTYFFVCSVEYIQYYIQYRLACCCCCCCCSCLTFQNVSTRA